MDDFTEELDDLIEFYLDDEDAEDIIAALQRKIDELKGPAVSTGG